ncbi:hypothetical protein D3C87_1505090 [compost metagenome]
MAQRIPLRGVLRRQRDAVVADDIRGAGHVESERITVYRHPVFLGRLDHRPLAARIKHGRAWNRQRQAQGKRKPRPDFGDGGQARLAIQVIERAELVVVPEIAPIRSVRTAEIPLRLIHGPCLLALFRTILVIVIAAYCTTEECSKWSTSSAV